jgi:putative toxin-antitoxin system antitoxin component (TIGR02293 family)
MTEMPTKQSRELRQVVNLLGGTRILAKATEMFGSQQEAEQWLERPAIGLNRRRPIDLLATPAGVELVEDFLKRLEYGVYV